MRSCEFLSALLMAATTVTVVRAISILGDYMCYTNSGCDGELLDVASDTDFSLRCESIESCKGSHIVVHSGCTLRSGGIQCIKQNSCLDATIAVDNSNLATEAGNYLNCGSSFAGVCTNLILTLTDSSIALLCGSDDCDYMQVHLFGSSTLELKTDSVITTDSSKALTIYVYDSSQLFDNGVSGYNLVTAATNTPNTQTTTSTPTVPITTTTISTPTIPSASENTLAPTGVNSTLTHESTEEDDSSNGGSNAGFSDAIVFGVILIGGGGVVLIAVVCGFCMGMKYRSNKQEQGGDEKDVKAQIALVPRTQSEGNDQQYNGSGYATKGRMSDAGGDAMSSSELSSEMMYMDMPKGYTSDGHLPHSPEGCQRQVEGGAYGIRAETKG